MLKLVGTDGTRYYAWSLKPGSYVVGRKDDVDFVINDRTVSRQHARVDVKDTTITLTDLESHNGTVINGRRLTGSSEVRDGDVVLFGQTEFKIVPEQVGSLPPTGRTATQFAERDPEKSVFLALDEVLKPLPGRIVDLPDFLPTFFELGKLLVLAEPKEEMVQRSLQLVGKIIPADRLAVLTAEGTDGEIVALATVIQGGKNHGSFQISRTVVNDILLNKNAVLIGDPADDPRFAQQKSIIMAEVKSAMAVPMFDEGRVLGILYVDTSNPLHRYHDEYLRLLATCGNLIASRLLNYQLLQERQEKQIIAAELLRASRIQQNLLKQTPPSVKGYTIGTYQVQSRQVGGDMYDAALLPDGRLLLLVADVSGKGMGAALLMSNILASFRILYEQPSFNLSKAVAQVSLELNKYSAAEDFATLFVGILDPANGKLSYVNAGHNSPLLVRARGSIDKLNATGFMVGAFPFGDWTEETASFSSGDQLVVFTDGVTEAEGPKGLFGDDQLEELVLLHRLLSPDELEIKITDAIKAFVDNTPQSDDITMLILRRDT